MGLLEEYWLEILSISFSLFALFISFYSLYLKRIDVEREKLAREITFGPIDDVEVSLEVIENRDHLTVQLINDTGIQQIVSEVWLQVEQCPKDLTDEQYARFRSFMMALMEASLRSFSGSGVSAGVDEGRAKGILGGRTVYLLALMILIVDRLKDDEATEVDVDRPLVDILRSTSRDLDDIVEMMGDPEKEWLVRKLLAPQMVANLEESVQGLMSERGYPIVTSIKLDVPPLEIRDVDLDVIKFAERLYERLDLIGGEFEFLCRLCAGVHKGEAMSKSELFRLRMVVEPVDLGETIGTIEAELERAIGQ